MTIPFYFHMDDEEQNMKTDSDELGWEVGNFDSEFESVDMDDWWNELDEHEIYVVDTDDGYVWVGKYNGNNMGEDEEESPLSTPILNFYDCYRLDKDETSDEWGDEEIDSMRIDGISIPVNARDVCDTIKCWSICRKKVLEEHPDRHS